MQLHELIAHLEDEDLRELAARCIPGSSTEAIGLLRAEVEARIRQPDYVERTVFARRPPALAVFVEILLAEGHRLNAEQLTERVRARAARWRRTVSKGELLAQDRDREIYRKVLKAAWSDDLQLDASEASLLGLLRRELGLSRSEHFLLGFHRSISHLWDETHAPEDLLRVLGRHGLLWKVGEDIALADEMEAPIRRATGIEIDGPGYVRLLDRLGASVLREVLAKASLRRSGSKADLVHRVADNLIAPSEVLATGAVNRRDLVDLAKNLNLTSYGKKHELIIRIVECFRTNADLTADKSDSEEAPQPIEPKGLPEGLFMTLFRPLSNHDLHALLGRLDLPLSGTKEVRIARLWSSRFAETTLLSTLKSTQLGQICQEHGVSRTGPKAQQIERLLDRINESVPKPQEVGGVDSAGGEGPHL